MAIVLPKLKPSLQPVEIPGSQVLKFEFPNPGDVFLLAAFIWATACFLLVTVGQRIALQLAKMAQYELAREVLRSEQTAIAGIMLIGFGVLAVTFFLIHRYRKATIGLLIFALTCQSIWNPTIHNVAFMVKYAVFIYLGTFGFLFFIKNGWRLVGAKYYRLYLAYVAWVAFVILLKGLSLGNVWYVSVEFILIVGYGIAWVSMIETDDDLLQFNMIITNVAVVMTVIHLLSPILVDNVLEDGRFASAFKKATAFSVSYTLVLITLFWRGMYETRPNVSRFFIAAALTGLAMILLSGTRNATAATMLGFICLWWVFRTKVFIYFLAAAFVGLLVQIFMGGDENLAWLGNRLQRLDSTRFETWQYYFTVVAESPVYGHSFDGVKSAVFGEGVAEFRAKYLGRVRVPGTHNNYIGVTVRWGLVGLFIHLSIYFFAFLQAARVIFSSAVPMESKRIYILPVAILVLVAGQAMFEDTITASGRGTLHGAMSSSLPMILYLYGGKLLARAKKAVVKTRPGGPDFVAGPASANGFQDRPAKSSA